MAILTISRELGASATYIALKIAEKMGYTCYDQQILNNIAEKMGKNQEQLQHFDQKSYNRIGVFFQEALASLAQGGMVFHPFGLGTVNWDATEMFSSYPQQNFKEQDYYDVLKQVFLELADKGNAIFLGRGGSQILKNNKNAFHIRIVANYEDRVKHIIKEETDGKRYLQDSTYKFGENPDSDKVMAEKLIRDWDTASANFISDFFYTDWNDPHNYHMIINTSRVNSDVCVDQICAVLKGME